MPESQTPLHVDLISIAESRQKDGEAVTFEDVKGELRASVSGYRDKPEVQAFLAQHPEASRFYSEAFNDEAKHAGFMAAHGDINELAALAQAEGYNLDAASLQSFQTGVLNAAAPDDELTDDELDMVAGGGGIGAFLLGSAGAIVGGAVGSVIGGITGGSKGFTEGGQTGFLGGAAVGATVGAFLPEP